MNSDSTGTHMDTRATPRGNCLMAIRELDGRYAGAPVELPVARQIFRRIPERAVVKRIHSHTAVISPIANLELRASTIHDGGRGSFASPSAQVGRRGRDRCS